MRDQPTRPAVYTSGAFKSLGILGHRPIPSDPLPFYAQAESSSNSTLASLRTGVSCPSVNQL